MVRRTQHRFFEPGRPMVIAHRGGSALAPENTVAAFDRAAELGVDAIEFDVHLSRDARLVVSHDPSVDRLTDGTGAIADLTLAEIEAFDAGYAFTVDAGATHPFRDRGLRLPELPAVFDRYPGARFSIELKVDGTDAAEVLLSTIREAGVWERVCVGSFHDEPVGWLRAQDPRLATHATASEVRRLLTLRRLGLGWLSRPAASVFTVPETAGHRRIVTPSVVRALQARGIDVHVWCVNDVADMQRLVAWGVRGIVTARPDLALTRLR